MNDLVQTADKTPIEVALKVEADNTVSARNVYEFLELRKADYSRWSRKNIVDNEFAAENVDFMPFVVKDERNPKPTTDYKLSVSFAKKLCMASNTARGEHARDYFILVEEKLKTIIISSKRELQELKDERKRLLYERDVCTRMLNAKIRLAELHLKLSKHTALTETERTEHSQMALFILLERKTPSLPSKEVTPKITNAIQFDFDELCNE
jgi:phage anti-repressor protein